MSARLMAIVAVTVAAVLLPSAAVAAVAAAAQDWRSPDARDAGQPKIVVQDLRSPDARDAATHVSPPAVPARLIVSSPGSFDWGDAAIGAGGAVGVLLVLTGARLAISRRRFTPSVTP